MASHTASARCAHEWQQPGASALTCGDSVCFSDRCGDTPETLAGDEGIPPINPHLIPAGCRCCFFGKVASALGAVAADTRATAAPLTKPSQLPALVALHSPGVSRNKNREIILRVAWQLAVRPEAATEISSPGCAP
jgi:hypothetical protein